MLPGEPLAQAAQGVLESPFLEVFNNCGDVALRVMVTGHGGVVGCVFGLGDLRGLS